MGKGRIITAHGEGRYTLEILEDRTRAESSRAMAVQRVAELDQRIEAAQAEVETLQQTVDDAAQEQSLAIALHQQQLADDGESDVDLAAYAVAVMEAAANRDRKRIEIGQMQADRLALQARIERIDALPPLRQVDAWCADYTEDLQGEVATAEVPGEVGQVIIKPGFDGNTWSAATDGAMQPALSSTPAGVFYNLAMLPGWQKWRPTFRIATISNIANDTGDITLIPAASSQQGLNVNMASAYDGVPIYYMECNGGAFSDGDRVLVAFSGNTGAPMVVGFESNPQTCGIDTVVAVPITLFFNDDLAFNLGSGCACGYQSPANETYSNIAMAGYKWAATFEGFSGWSAGNLAAALSASSAEDLPPADFQGSSSTILYADHREPPVHSVEFPAEVDGSCVTEQANLSRLAVTRADADVFLGEKKAFFNGDLVVPQEDKQTLTLDNHQFGVSYLSRLQLREFESAEAGVYTFETDPSCSAAYLLSKARNPDPYHLSNFLISFLDMPSVTVNGQRREAKGFFHVIEGEMEYSGSATSIGGTTYSHRFIKTLYIMAGYGR